MFVLILLIKSQQFLYFYIVVIFLYYPLTKKNDEHKSAWIQKNIKKMDYEKTHSLIYDNLGAIILLVFTFLITVWVWRTVNKFVTKILVFFLHFFTFLAFYIIGFFIFMYLFKDIIPIDYDFLSLFVDLTSFNDNNLFFNLIKFF